MPKRDLLAADGLSSDELRVILDAAEAAKNARTVTDTLSGRSIGMSFANPQPPARAAVEVAIHELGAHPVDVSGMALHGRAESGLAATAQALSGYLHALVLAGVDQSRLELVAAAAGVPVVNAGSDFSDPCQALADLLTIRAYKGELEGRKLAYLGDGGAVANSLLRVGALAGMHVAVASPPGYEPIPQVVELSRKLAAEHGGSVLVTANPLEAARDADVVATDSWVGPEDDDERDARSLIFRPFQVGYHVMDAASPDAIVMHRTPARMGEEVAPDAVSGQQFVAWQQSENVLHVYKAMLAFLLEGGP